MYIHIFVFHDQNSARTIKPKAEVGSEPLMPSITKRNKLNQHYVYAMDKHLHKSLVRN